MKGAELKNRDYIQIDDARGKTFGGRQHWLEENGSRALALCSCGAVAAADLLLYLARSRPEWETPLCAPLVREGPISRERYSDYLGLVARRYARPLPPLGKTGFGLSRGVERYFAENRIALRAEWRQLAFSRRPADSFAEMLADDLPVILSVPAFPLKIKSLNFYHTAQTKRTPSNVLRYRERTGHFVTACALRELGGGLALEVSSWGRRFYIDWDEYLASAKRGAGLITCGYIQLRPSAQR